MSTRLYQCIEAIGNKIIENKDFLTDLDREIGDADHGVNMARGFSEVLTALSQDETFLTARKNLEEVRLSMTVEANLRLIDKGFAIDTAPTDRAAVI